MSFRVSPLLNAKSLVFIVLLAFTQTQCGILKKEKDGNSVEEAEAAIAKDRQRRQKEAKRAHDDALKAHWDRQSPQAKRTVKMAKRKHRKMLKDKRKANRERKSLSKK